METKTGTASRAPDGVRQPSRVRLAATPRNVAILRHVHHELSRTLVAARHEAAVRSVEQAVRARGKRPLRARLHARWAWRVGTVFAAADAAAIALARVLTGAPRGTVPLLVTAAVMLIICNRTDLHRSRLALAVLDDLPAQLLVSVAGTITAVGLGATDLGTGPAATSSQPVRAVAFGAAAFVLFALTRLIVYPVVHRLRRSRLVAHPVVIVGAGYVGRRLAAAMRAHPEYGLVPVGFVGSEQGETERAVPVLGTLADLPAVLEHYDVHDVVFAFSTQPDAQLVRIVRCCVCLDLQVFVVPRYFELCRADRKASVEVVWGIPLMRLRRWPLRPSRRWIKRAMDIAFASAALVALAPLLALIALAVRLDGAPVIFRQQRIGRDGEPFVLYKFRSLTADAAEAEQRWNVDGDPRISRTGRFLRRSSLDELPQLVNVLRGQMSLVGPRPERPLFVQAFSRRVRRYSERHRVATGLTGWAQVNGLRGDTSIEDRISFDNYYIDNWSLWSDVKILLRTLVAVIRHVAPDGQGQSGAAEPQAATALAGEPAHG